ncbi:MAG: anti-sigma factor family protein [Gammaproteobacteria bacterium]
MNCLDIQTKLDDFLDESVSDAERQTLESHLKDCAQCRAALEKAQALRGALRALPVEGPAESFYERALHHAMEHDRRRPHFFVGGAIAAGFALMLVGVLLFKQPAMESGRSPQDIPGLTISINEARDVKLVFNSSQALAQAAFTVMLPPGVELRGYPDQREITWEGSLQQGKNLLVLPLIARNTGGGELTAYVSHGDKRKTVRLRMKINQHQGLASPSPGNVLS